jgi:hypothetical protein
MTEANVALHKRAVIAELTRSPHGKLAEYLPTGRQAVAEDPEFFAHLVAWNAVKGQVKDAAVALPIIALGARTLSSNQPEFTENALAHLGKLDLRLMVKKALPFAEAAGIKTTGALFTNFFRRFLAELEAKPALWDTLALQHRRSLKRLYSLYSIRPGANRADHMRAVLWGENEHGAKLEDPESDSVFTAVAALSTLAAEDPAAAARLVVNRRIPFLIAQGALGEHMKHPDLLRALITRMTSTELTTHAKALERHFPEDEAAELSAYMAQALEGKAAAGAPRASLKATKQAELAEARGQTGVAAALRKAQEAHLGAQGGIDGNWLILADVSPSMSPWIPFARNTAAALARFVKGRVALSFFHSTPRIFDVTGKTLEQIEQMTRNVVEGPGTSIGCGLRQAADANLNFDGIAIISDGEENTAPLFVLEFRAYQTRFGKDPTVYLYLTSGSGEPLLRQMAAAGFDVQVFDLRGKSVDYYAIPNLVQTMRVSRYGLLDEVMDTRLLTLDAIWPLTAGRRVIPSVTIQPATVTI